MIFPKVCLQGLLGRLLDEVEGEAPPDATARGDVFREDAVDTAPTSVENASGSMSPASPVLPPDIAIAVKSRCPSWMAAKIATRSAHTVGVNDEFSIFAPV